MALSAALRLAALGPCLALALGGPSMASEQQCSEWEQSYLRADATACMRFDHHTSSCITEKAALRDKLVTHCRAERPVVPVGAALQHNLTIIVPTVNRPESYLLQTLMALWPQLPPCDRSSGSRPAAVTVAVYNTGADLNPGFAQARDAARRLYPCTRFVTWFHAYEQPFPEVPYIAEEGPDWQARRDIPNREQVEQSYDYVSMLRDAFWFFPSRAYLLLEDDFNACTGAVQEVVRVQELLDDGEPSWAGAQFSYGGSGWLVARGFVRQLAAYVEAHAYARPVDLLFHMYFATTRRPVFAAALVAFEHAGNASLIHPHVRQTYARCGQPNALMHFRTSFVPCPYEELERYLCDRPHAEVVWLQHGPREASVGPDGAFAPPAFAQGPFAGHPTQYAAADPGVPPQMFGWHGWGEQLPPPPHVAQAAAAAAGGAAAPGLMHDPRMSTLLQQQQMQQHAAMQQQMQQQQMQGAARSAYGTRRPSADPATGEGGAGGGASFQGVAAGGGGADSSPPPPTWTPPDGFAVPGGLPPAGASPYAYTPEQPLHTASSHLHFRGQAA